MKPIHARWLIGLYDYLRNNSDSHKKGFKLAGIDEALDAEFEIEPEDPFHDLLWLWEVMYVYTFFISNSVTKLSVWKLAQKLPYKRVRLCDVNGVVYNFCIYWCYKILEDVSRGFDGNNKSKVHTHNYCDSYPLPPPPPPPHTHTTTTTFHTHRTEAYFIGHNFVGQNVS